MPNDALPGDAVRHALAAAAIHNAHRLLRDGWFLLEAGSYPTAQSLAVLALEEAGKAVACHRIAGADEQANTRSQFVRQLTLHTAKLQRARNFLDLLDALPAGGMADTQAEYLEKLISQARDDNDNKMRGFYVDLDDTDQVRTPEDVSNDEARLALETAAFTTSCVNTLLVKGESLRWESPGGWSPGH